MSIYTEEQLKFYIRNDEWQRKLRILIKHKIVVQTNVGLMYTNLFKISHQIFKEIDRYDYFDDYIYEYDDIKINMGIAWFITIIKSVDFSSIEDNRILLKHYQLAILHVILTSLYKGGIFRWRELIKDVNVIALFNYNQQMRELE